MNLFKVLYVGTVLVFAGLLVNAIFYKEDPCNPKLEVFDKSDFRINPCVTDNKPPVNSGFSIPEVSPL